MSFLFPKGTAAFALEPLITVEGPLAEVQLVETALLNIINFQTLAATKAARLWWQPKKVSSSNSVCVGLRGSDGGLSLVRGAFVGGVRRVQATNGPAKSLIYLSRAPMPTAGSWPFLMSFQPSVRMRMFFPDSSILLVDTYVPSKRDSQCHYRRPRITGKRVRTPGCAARFGRPGLFRAGKHGKCSTSTDSQM